MNTTILADVIVEGSRADAEYHRDYPDGTSQSNAAVADKLRASCDRKDRAGTTTWADVLAEETAESICETNPARLRAELIQVAAVAVRWVRSLDARYGPALRAGYNPCVGVQPDPRASALVSAAAEAHERFGDDELERFAEARQRPV